jgi:hypothetical protein
MFFRHPRRWLAPYAEGLLPGAQASEVASHVLSCQGCRRALDQVRAGQALVARLPRRESAPTWRELAPLLDAPPSRSFAPLRWTLAAAAALAVAAGGLAWRGPRPVEARASVSAEALALAAHRTPFELRTSDPQAVRRWVGDAELPLPPADQHRQLEGACRLAGGAVSLGYRLGDQKVTLVIAEAARSTARKVIDRRTDGDLQVASWTRGNRSFALVSRLRGDVSCAVCHATSGPAAVL